MTLALGEILNFKTLYWLRSRLNMIYTLLHTRSSCVVYISIESPTSLTNVTHNKKSNPSYRIQTLSPTSKPSTKQQAHYAPQKEGLYSQPFYTPKTPPKALNSISAQTPYAPKITITTLSARGGNTQYPVPPPLQYNKHPKETDLLPKAITTMLGRLNGPTPFNGVSMHSLNGPAISGCVVDV